MSEMSVLVVGDMVMEHNFPHITNRTKNLVQYVGFREQVRTERIGRILRYPLALDHVGGRERLNVLDKTDWQSIQSMMYISMQPEEYQTTKDIFRGMSFEMFANMENDTSGEEDATRIETAEEGEDGTDHFDFWFGQEAIEQIEALHRHGSGSTGEPDADVTAEINMTAELETTKSGDET